MRYQQKKLEEARSYTYNYLLDQGFYGFKQDKVHFILDTLALGAHKVWLQMHIDAPTGTPSARRYLQDSVGVLVQPQELGTHYLSKHEGLFFNTDRYQSVLRRHIFIQPNAYYSQTKVEQTRYMLNSLDVFQYIDIYQDTIGTRLQTKVRLRKHKRYDFFQEAGLEISQGGLPSPSVSLGVKSRDLLGFLEVIELSGHFSLNGISNPRQRSQPYRGFEYSMQGMFRHPGILFSLYLGSCAALAYTTKYTTKIGRLCE